MDATDPKIRFMWVIQALAQPADKQIALFPPFVEVADELALEHQETQELFFSYVDKQDLEPYQLSSIEALDEMLEEMSGPSDAQFWSIESLETKDEWEDIRRLARSVLSEMGWVFEVPPKNLGQSYIENVD